MGRLQAEEMRSLCDENTALAWHLAHNHYPPIPAEMIPVCKKAIKAGNQGKFDKKIKLPEGVEHRTHGKSVPAQAILEHAHLWDFLERKEDDD